MRITDTLEGFTRAGMAAGWMKRKSNPVIKHLRKENQELRETLAAILERLDRIEEREK